MCNVCGALKLTRGEHLVSATNSGDEYEIKATSKSAEEDPAIYTLRKNNNWSKVFVTNKCLADIVAKGGFDVSPKDEDQIEWLDSHFKS